MSIVAECTWWGRTDKMTPFVDGVSSPIYRNLDTGEEKPFWEMPIGALWEVGQPRTYPNGAVYPRPGYDGKSIACMLPSTSSRYGKETWHIDERASNCTMPDDHVHRCWVRHGSIGERVHVDKNGNTCQAGAGSIVLEGFHGFLHDHQVTTA